jgi:hypothetical protein
MPESVNEEGKAAPAGIETATMKASYVRFDEEGDVVACEDRVLHSGRIHVEKGKSGGTHGGGLSENSGRGEGNEPSGGDGGDGDAEYYEGEEEEEEEGAAEGEKFGKFLRANRIDLYSKLRLQQGTDENFIESQARLDAQIFHCPFSLFLSKSNVCRQQKRAPETMAFFLCVHMMRLSVAERLLARHTMHALRRYIYISNSFHAYMHACRASYHKLSSKWNPSNYKSRPIVCDLCTVKLSVGEDWYHKKGEFYDLCGADHSQLQ